MFSKKYNLNTSKVLLNIFFLILITFASISCKASQTADTTTVANDTTTVTQAYDQPQNNEAPIPNGERPPKPPEDFDKDKPNGPPPENNNLNFMGANTNPSTYTAVNSYDEDTDIQDIDLSSTGKDESAILVDKNITATINNFKIDRTSSDSTGGDTASFYGVGAATLVTNGTLNLNVGEINTDSKGGAGVFAYGDGVANVNNVDIVTKKDTSGGIHVAGGGTLYAANVNATTSGESSAAIRSDRGGGKMVVDGGTFTTNGSGSPAIYSTADIEVNDAKLIANKSEGICIEGLNSITLRDSELTSMMQDLSQNDCTWSVIVYQSMSGDSKIGKGTFNMEGGSLTTKNGGVFYTTNTESEFNIKNITINTTDDSEFLLKATGNNNERGWGAKGANGATCTFNARTQELSGKIIYDSISTLDINLLEGTTFTGYIVRDDSATNGANTDGHANLTIDENSHWVLTNDSELKTLTIKGSKDFLSYITDSNNNEVKIEDLSGNILHKGTSPYTIKVSELIM